MADAAFRPLQSGLATERDPQEFDLPLTHATTTLLFDKIVAEKELRPALCPKFSESLLYFFVGRMAYRMLQDAEPSFLLGHSPLVLILKPEAVGTPGHVFPFDTGGYPTFYQGVVRNEPRSDFELDDMATARKLIAKYWRSPKAYFKLDPRQVKPLPKKNGSIHRSLYDAILRGQGVDKGDDRRGTIEVSVTGPVAISSQNLAAMIVPDEYMEDGRFKPLADSLVRDGVLIRTYDWYGGRPIEYLSELRKLSLKLMQRLGYY